MRLTAPLCCKTVVVLASAWLMLGLAACSTQVTRLEPTEVKDLSGAWNDTDSRLVSEEMVQDALARPWIQDFTGAKKKPPVVIVGEVRNLSHEHINVNTFVADLERALINSGRVEFVASRNERGEVREERRDQDIHAREETRKAMGQETGADFMLKGTINTIIDVEGKTQVRYYQVDLNLISLVDNRKVWVGQKKIKKLVERSQLRY
jgi:penicillin-binding protein activator